MYVARPPPGAENSLGMALRIASANALELHTSRALASRSHSTQRFTKKSLDPHCFSLGLDRTANEFHSGHHCDAQTGWGPFFVKGGTT